MGASVGRPNGGTHANTLHSDLQAIKAGSHVARMTVNQSLSRAAARHAMATTNTSQKEFALKADAAESAVSDAMNERGRNLETDWLLAQADDFLLAWWQFIEAKRGLTSESKRAVKAERIAELIRLIVEVA